MPLAPDPRVTPEMVRFINACEELEPEDTGALFPFADKSGYHNTVERNLQRWPGNYSTRLPDDLRGNRKVCRAFDWISESARLRGDQQTMTRYGTRVRDAYLRRDPRLKGWREWLTYINGQLVGYDFVSWTTRTPDSSHKMHHHGSVLTAYVGHWPTYAGMLSILADEPLAVWQAGRSRYQQEGPRMKRLFRHQGKTWIGDGITRRPLGDKDLADVQAVWGPDLLLDADGTGLIWGNGADVGNPDAFGVPEVAGAVTITAELMQALGDQVLRNIGPALQDAVDTGIDSALRRVKTAVDEVLREGIAKPVDG